MNRSLRDSLRNIPLQHRRGGLSLNGGGVPNSSKDPPSSDDNNYLDLFSKSRRTLSLASSSSSDDDDPADVPALKLGRLSIGSAKQGKNGLDEFLSSAEGGGKHDYDWLLTPPGTPLVASSDGNESQQGLNIAPRRSVSTTKASRLSVSQSEINNHVAKPTTRSSSMTRPSVSSSQYSTYSNNKSTNILNTSAASVSSYIRPSTPTPTRSSSITTARPSTPSGRSTVSSSRSTTPSRPRPSSSSSSAMDKPRQSSQNSRPSTPTSRPQLSSNVNYPANRVTTSSRPSMPIRRPSLSPVSVPSTPGGGGRSLPNGGHNSVSRPSSPSPRVRSTVQPIVLPDFPLDTPPNLRTTLPERPISAGRSRPRVAALAAKGNVEPMMTTSKNNNSSAGSVVPTRGRQSSPVVSRGRLAAESTGRGHRTLAPANENLGDAALDSRRELLTRKPASKTSIDSMGFGRTISKKSLDMAIRHMDIRNGSNGSRPLTGSNLFPQSIRSSNQKSQQPGAFSVNGNHHHLSMGAIAENGNHINARFYEGGSEENNRTQSSAKLSNIDIYESSRYDMILLKEDLTNTNWLHNLDDKTDQGPIFDNGFELLPEPFDHL